MKTKEQIDDIKQKIADFVPVMDQLSRARNPFELRYFVIGKHDDRIQQYKQAVIEMDAKYKAIREAIHGKKVRDLEIEKIELSMIDPTTRLEEIENEKKQLEIDKLKYEEHDSLIAVTGAVKEVLDFIHIIETEYSDLMDKTEEELLKHEVEYWKARLSKQIHIDLMSPVHAISEGNRSVLQSMPKEIQEEIYAMAMIRTEEVKQLEEKMARQTLITLSESYPRPTAFIAPPDYTTLKLRKDAPYGYPEDRIVNIDHGDIMIATLHRPDDQIWLSESFYIPSGKNYMKHWETCDNPDMVGEWRNRIVKDALSLGCEYLFFVDDDLLVENDALQRLFAHNLDIVGGWYPKKTPVIESATLISDGKQSKQGVPLDTTGLIEVDWSLSAGLTLIKTDVFKKIPYPWYLTTDRATEDTYFTQRAREAGIKSYLDTSIKAIHVDKATMTGYSFEGIKKLQ